MARFTLPRDLYYGKGAMEELRQALQGYKKGFIVVGGHSMQKNGFLKKLEDILQEAGLATQVFEGVEPDPSVETVMRGAQAMRDFDYAASGYQLDLTPGRVFYFYHDCARFFKYVRPVCRA